MDISIKIDERLECYLLGYYGECNAEVLMIANIRKFPDMGSVEDFYNHKPFPVEEMRGIFEAEDGGFWCVNCDF